LRQIPHALTLLRLLLAPLLACLIIASRFREALLLVVLAGLTDWFDGFAARRLRVTGRLGEILDPLADKTMLVTLFLALAYVGLIPGWILALVMGRDLVIVIGALLLRIFRNVRKFVPSMLGKVSTFFQIVFVLLVLLDAAFPLKLLDWLRILALLLTTLFTAWSGYGYVRLGVQLTRLPPVTEATE
jgi:cardiolipin synthase (CMP-forming)